MGSFWVCEKNGCLERFWKVLWMDATTSLLLGSMFELNGGENFIGATGVYLSDVQCNKLKQYLDIWTATGIFLFQKTCHDYVALNFFVLH